MLSIRAPRAPGASLYKRLRFPAFPLFSALFYGENLLD